MPKNPFQKLVKKVSDHYDADVAIYIGPIDRPYDDLFIGRCKYLKKKKNIVLILTTLGGDPHAAYRMARCLQDLYSTAASDGPLEQTGGDTAQGGTFILFVDTRCKSAGTIIATGATKLLMSDYGELGPIDVQLRKGDEVGERSSGLTPMHAIEALQELSSKHFEDCFKKLRFGEELLFTTKVASDIAQKVAVGLFGGIYGQIDPMRIGEFDRAMRIAGEYGNRLGKTNLKPEALQRLLMSYPSHSSVIDRKEAKELFESVEMPSGDLENVGEITRNWWNQQYLTAKEPLFLYLTTEEVLKEDEDDVKAAPPAAAAPEPAPAPVPDAGGHDGVPVPAGAI